MSLHRISIFQRRIFCMLVLTAFLSVSVPQHASAASPGEHQIKAAMIFNMMRFVDWPESALPNSDEDIDICVVSRGAMATAVESLRGKQVKGKNIAIRHISKSAGFSGCHVLLLSDTDRQTTSAILEQTRSAPLMTVSDSCGFTATGGVFGFILLNGKIRFEVNLASAQKHRIRISSQLLKLAQSVME
jgi:YfiR/HmsC-like